MCLYQYWGEGVVVVIMFMVVMMEVVVAAGRMVLVPGIMIVMVEDSDCGDSDDGEGGGMDGS